MNMKSLEQVRDYYGKVLQSSSDLKTGACCTTESMPRYLRKILGEIHIDVKTRFYGCGSPIPQALEGCTVLDLGCGTGRDCFMLSKLVGPNGQVIGLDMTEEQLAVARQYQDYHREAFGHPDSNIRFLSGYIEDLQGAGIKDNSVDAVVSNCVINLSPDKAQVFSEILRVLKPGGELYFSDVFTNRRVPDSLAQDPVLLGECLGGALYIEDFRRLMHKLGVQDYRITARSTIPLLDEEIEAKAGMIEFHSLTIRAFKLPLEDRCEDYGQTARYLGGIADCPQAFVLDDNHSFEQGRHIPVCGNTARMLQHTRYGKYFDIAGDMGTHYGLFNCGPAGTGQANSDSTPDSCC